MGQIELLDQNMINMIAAGEVIERPASVVKELMENSIDAGATKIIVTIEDGGRKLISITDNGCGMDADDLAKAFEPHATSKIKTSKDLLAISTLGFRGEALASIASIAQVKAASRLKGSNSANVIEIDCGSKTTVSPCSADYGTTIQVRDIFYKLPARRKFLRTANTEMGHITEQFIRIALANGNLDLTLIHNNREIYRLLETDSLRQRIATLFPSPSGSISDELIEAQSSEKALQIYALMGRPEISRTSNKFQYIFLNGRFIHDKFISHAIKEAYRGLLEPNRFPVVFLFIKMPHEDYDVNVHPTKNEVRFYNANLVHSQILGALREKLLGTNLHTPAQLPSAGEHNTFSRARPVRDQKIADAMAEFFKKHRPAQSQPQFKFKHSPAVSGHNRPSAEFEVHVPPAAQSDRKFIQIHDSFIVAQTDDGFVLIDQHALHERIMYEALCKRVRESRLQSQKLLMPESFEVTEAQAEMLENNSELIEKLGIELVPFAPRTMAIQAFPTLLAKAEPLDFIQDLIEILENKQADIDSDRLLEEILDMAACKAAIKAGQKLTPSEIEQLLADKESVDCSSRCPHGRPTTIEFSISELEKQFKRT
ncbi:MAG: DNA mismatch repair endonuclease MutL [Sedimentisphaerales bacterium]|nr:DNA mismatch repair endonuclease MutL [Sedimentisphaerales bacterium]